MKILVSCFKKQPTESRERGPSQGSEEQGAALLILLPPVSPGSGAGTGQGTFLRFQPVIGCFIGQMLFHIILLYLLNLMKLLILPPFTDEETAAKRVNKPLWSHVQ